MFNQEPCNVWFRLIHEKAAFLDLGDVKYAASVRLNGKALGSKLFSPFIFRLEGALQKGENTLEIVVTNTLANILNDKAVLKDWQSRFTTSKYQERQLYFEQLSLASGLFGPVTLRAEEVN